jgi:hypothetical protein
MALKRAKIGAVLDDDDDDDDDDGWDSESFQQGARSCKFINYILLTKGVEIAQWYSTGLRVG